MLRVCGPRIISTPAVRPVEGDQGSSRRKGGNDSMMSLRIADELRTVLQNEQLEYNGLRISKFPEQTPHKPRKVSQ
eukprot:2127658-Amphidinium_carterae.1